MKKKLPAIFLAAVMIAQPGVQLGAYAAEYSNHSYTPHGARRISAPENIFYTNDGKEFVLLDKKEGENGGYFCIAADSYGTLQFDQNNTTKSDLEDDNNILYRLNKALTGEQEINGLQALPAEIAENIDYEHVWECDKGRGYDNYEVTCGVNLLSMGEYFEYIEKIGTDDNLTIGWWTRTPNIQWQTHVLWLGIGTTKLGASVSWDANGTRQVRPCFWLKDDFFKNTKLSSDKLGSNVKKEIIASADDASLAALGYTDEEISEIHNTDYDTQETFSITMPPYEGKWYGVSSFDFELSLNLTANEPKNYRVIGYLDDKQFIEDNVRVEKNSTKKVTYNTGEMGNADHKLKFEIYDGKRLAGKLEKSFCVMKDYEHQFMEEYSGKGFNHHLRLTTNYLKEIAAMKRIGVMAVRDAAQWNSMEKIKKQYDYSTDKWMLPTLENVSGKFLWVFAFNNNLYSHLDNVGDPIKHSARNKEVYDNYSEYANDVLNHYKTIDYAMIWNEPVGAGFWKPGVDIPSYAYLATVAGAYIKENAEKNKLKTKTMAGSAPPDYAAKLADTGAYPFIDAWGGTYYSNDPSHEYSARRVHEEYIKRGFGGWKKLVSYEFGFPTSVGRFTEDEEARNIVIQYVLQDALRYDFQSVYQFNNFGFSATDREQNFGVVKNGGEPKKALYSVATFYSRINGAKYIGRIQNDDFVFVLYYKDGKPIGVVWSKDGVHEFAPGCDFSAYDLNDSPMKVENGKVLIGESPVYITGLGKDFLLKSVSDSVRDEAETMLDYYARLLGDEPEYDSRKSRFESMDSENNVKFNEEVYNELMDKKEDGAFGYRPIKEKLWAKLAEFEEISKDGMPDADSLKAYIDSYYALGDEFMEMYKNNEIHMSMREFSGFMFSLHWIGEYFANLYMAAVPEDANLQVSPKAVLAALKSEMQAAEDKEVGGIYEFGESMLKYAMDYADEAEDVAGKNESNPQKAGVIASRALMAEKIGGWIKKFRDIEGISGGRVFLQMTRDNRVLYNFAKNEAVFSLYNFGKKDFSGEIGFYDSEGNELFKTPASVKAGDTCEVKQKFDLKNMTENRKLYTVKLTSGGKVFYEEKIDDITLAELCAVKMNSSTESFEDLTEVSFDVENTFNGAIDVTLKVTPPDGWTLKETEKNVSVKAGETKTVSFGVKAKSKTDFNEYYFDADVVENGEVIAHFEDTPLQFTYVPRAQFAVDVAGFNGDISAWKNSYPVMVNTPEKPSDEKSWDNANAAMRVYTQWDDRYLYVLARVNDDIHLNSQAPGANIWNGDNIQISIDADHTRTTGYDNGDYEYGFSLLDSGQANTAWRGDNEAFNNMEYKIVRNEQDKTTMYLLKFPEQAVAPLRLKAGSRFGMNFVLNECDYIVRDYYYELTEGTAKTKSPIYYHTWVLGR